MLSPGLRVGPYEIVSSLGAGGMGEVYRATDTRLDRDVALKVLPESVASDPERAARFNREAQLLAALNHPNVASLYGVEEATAGRALVMELVEGPTLADRLAHGPIPLDEGVPIARQLAEAIEYAHENGVIHRDLKPANIKLRSDGTVKVLDFGLAKALDHSGPGSRHRADSPTVSAATEYGLILGTAAYMAPEQAKGKPVDRRADIWSFGAVLFEMLTGRPVYGGETTSETMARVITQEPDWSALPAATPPRLKNLLRRCLVKDPRRRLQAIGEARIALEDDAGDSPIELGEAASDPSSRASSGRHRQLLAVAAALALVGGGFASAWLLNMRNGATVAATRRFTITLPESEALPLNRGTLLALSPDGRTLVYQAVREGQALFFRRPLDRFDAAPIAGTEDASEPFFSSDGQSIGFHARSVLSTVALSGGAAQPLTPTRGAIRGGSWTPDGHITFGLHFVGRLLRIPSSGGEASTLFTSTDLFNAWYPQAIPGTDSVVFTLSQIGPDRGDLHLLQVPTGAHRLLLRDAVAGRVLPTGHLAFVRNGSLWAVPFDDATLTVIGDPVQVVEGVRVDRSGAVQFAVADDGSLAYVPGNAAEARARALVIVERDGGIRRLPAPVREYASVAWSPEQSRIATQIGLDDEADLWITDLARGTLTRITAEPGFDGHPLWSSDGRHVVFASAREGRWQLRRRRSDGAGNATVLASFDQGTVRPYSWTPDGQTLLFDLRRSRTEAAIGILPLNGSGRWRVLSDMPADSDSPVISPDGRWIAYSSSSSGQDEVYVERFPQLGERWVASVGEAYMPMWARDGRALYFMRGANEAVMRATFQTDASGGTPAIGTAEPFQVFTYFSMPFPFRLYDISSDGQRLLAIGFADDGKPAPSRQINVVLNWFNELNQLVPVK